MQNLKGENQSGCWQNTFVGHRSVVSSNTAFDIHSGADVSVLRGASLTRLEFISFADRGEKRRRWRVQWNGLFVGSQERSLGKEDFFVVDP